MKQVVLSKSQARKIILHAAGLSRRAQFGKGREAVYKLIDHLGFVQIDTNYVVERAHHHTIASRIPDYKPEWLEELQADERIFEYLTYASGYIPMNDFRYSLPMKESFLAKRKTLERPEINLMNKVLDRILREGPLMARDFENDRVGVSSGWWDWRPSTLALERLYFDGRLMTTHRKNFQKVFDLPVNMIPGDVDTTMPSPEEYARHVIRRSLKALGIACGKDIARRARFVKNSVKMELEKLVADGEVCPVEIAGLKGSPLYMLSSYKSRKISLPGDVFILSPFDVLNVFRHRLKDFFDFDYQVECFVPAAKRKYGYFSLPVLMGDTFVARMDAKADREQKVLTINNLHFEPVKLTKPMIGRVSDAIKIFAGFNQCQGVTIKKSNHKALRGGLLALLTLIYLVAGAQQPHPPLSGQRPPPPASRQRISINEGWGFMRFSDEPDNLVYDERPVVSDHNDNKVADTKASESAVAVASDKALRNWILPSANDFIKDPSKRHLRPPGNPGSSSPFVQNNFDDGHWQQVNLPHDWAIKGPFYTGTNATVGGGMGRLPVQGVAWYRRKLDISAADAGKSIYLDIDGAMSYAMVWLNGHLVGGWPYGYTSFRLDLTPYVKPGGDNQLAIRLDNPPNSSRWYPGAGLYRNVWLEKLNPIHVARWGTCIKTKNVTAAAATVDISVQLENTSASAKEMTVVTEVVAAGKRVVDFPAMELSVKAGEKQQVRAAITIRNPLLWGPPPFQQPNMYVAITRVYAKGTQVDEYETRFGIRSVEFDPVKGVSVNGKPVRIQGVNQHHDLGALGAAFNPRAAERQLEILREMGCNAIRLAHNPPAPELLDLTDRMGFLVIDEIFDCWYKGKTPLDFHLIFADWHEPDIRSFVRRDKNHPSVIEWSFGNEVGEQYTGEGGAAIANELHDIVRDEDSTRPATASINYAKPDMPFPAVMDILSLNYQGEGIRDAPAYAYLGGIRTSPLYPAFQQRFPDKMIQSSETSSTLSTRGTYIFPVYNGISAPVSDSTGGDSKNKYVSAYDLYTAAFGASPDKVFNAQDHNPYVAGEFVWSGWDYLGEPTPYYSARSSYSGIIDLAGFRKDRFYLYQSRWRPDLPMAHLLPHWTWPDRAGKITPVHVYTSGDEAELFLNNTSQGRKKKAPYEYRLRWDSVRYEPGELRVVVYKKGKPWATDTVKTAGAAAKLGISADRDTITADGSDLSFITVSILDSNGVVVPEADNEVSFDISGPGEIVATDNGNPADMVSFASKERAAFSGLSLAIVRSMVPKPVPTTPAGDAGRIVVTAKAKGLRPASIVITTIANSASVVVFL